MIVIGCIFRPHVTDGPSCWCLPQMHVCEEHGEVWVHNALEARPDNQERMASFSEQRRYGPPLRCGVVLR